MLNFLGQEIQTGKNYVYLKNEQTGSSTDRKLCMIGTCQKVAKQLYFLRLFAEGYPFQPHTVDIVRNEAHVICEYTPKIDQWL